MKQLSLWTPSAYTQANQKVQLLTIPSWTTIKWDIITMDKDEDPLDWWRARKQNYPNMIQLVKKYLCIPATSTQAERAFSALGFLLNKRRLCLSGSNVNAQLFLHDNLELWSANNVYRVFLIHVKNILNYKLCIFFFGQGCSNFNSLIWGAKKRKSWLWGNLPENSRSKYSLVSRHKIWISDRLDWINTILLILKQFGNSVFLNVT